jgi:hypothetical protein
MKGWRVCLIVGLGWVELWFGGWEGGAGFIDDVDWC